MKKLISLLLIFVMCGALCACSSDGKADTSNASYVPPDDVELVFVGVGGQGGLSVVVKNNSNQAIKDISVDIVCYDRNGYSLDIVGRGLFEYPSVNIPSGEIKNLDGYGYGIGTSGTSTPRYVEGVISCIEYMDGSTWESDSVEAWKENIKQDFDILEWKNKIENMRELAEKAISDNKHMSISIQGSSRDSFVHANVNINVGNIGNRAITSFTILMLCSDSNGFPVNTGHGDLATNSCSYIMEGSSAKSNAHGTGSFEFYISQAADIQSLEGIVSEIEFSDGTVWENPYAPYWELYYGDVVGK